MINLFKMIYVNLLGLFDINKIIVARKDGVKSNLENRTVVMAIGAIAVGYIIYTLLGKLSLTNSIYFLSIGFLISSLYCFLTDLTLIEPVIFNNSDNEYLFSLPVSKNQIVFSKLFSVYLKNIFLVVVIMLSTLFAYLKVGSVNETIVLMFVVCTLFIPFVPIIVGTMIAYVNAYYKVKANKKLFNIVKYGLILLVLVLVIAFVRNSNIAEADDIVKLITKINTMYPFGVLFTEIVNNENVIFFVLYIILNIMMIMIYNNIMSNNIMKISSMLQGVNKEQFSSYKRTKNYHTVFGIVRKEYSNMFSFKSYFVSSFGINIVVFVLLIIGINAIDIESIKQIEYFKYYFNSYAPALIGAANTLGLMTISSISLEKENMQMLMTMPVSMGRILFSKWLANVLLGSIFVIVDALIIMYKFSITGYAIIYFIGEPILILMLMSLTGLVLDYTFVSKNEDSDNIIIRQRLLPVLVPIISIFVGFLPILLNLGLKLDVFSGAYMVGIIIIIVMEVLYLRINRKKLRDNLFN